MVTNALPSNSKLLWNISVLKPILSAFTAARIDKVWPQGNEIHFLRWFVKQALWTQFQKRILEKISSQGSFIIINIVSQSVFLEGQYSLWYLLVIVFVILLAHLLCSVWHFATKRIPFKDPWRGGCKEPGTHMECRKRK